MVPDPAAAGSRPKTPPRILYATSADGLRWDKPALGHETVLGNSDNNIIGGYAQSCAILIDPSDPDASRRYKMITARSGGYFALYSADGTRWHSYSSKPVLAHGDTVTLARDPFNGDYLAYHKRPYTSARGFNVRVVWLARSRDFVTWSEPEMVFAADAADDEGWVTRPDDRTEVYDMPVFPHAAGFIGLPAMFRNRPQTFTAANRPAGAVSPDGPLDIQIVTSADGKVWRRSWPRLNIIPRGKPGTYDGGAILNTACAPVHHGDETWVYYTAINTGHGKGVPPKRISIGRAEWRLHGFASADAGPDGGQLQTHPLHFASDRLVINADASRGHLRVGLQEEDGRPIPGYTLEESEPLRADSVRWTARWGGKTAVPTDRPVRLLIEMESCQLFSVTAGAEGP